MTSLPGFWIDFDTDGFSGTDDRTTDLMSITWSRGGTPDLGGSIQPGSATAVLRNKTGNYLPDNSAGAFFGKLRPGLRVWFGCNADGTLHDKSATVYGLFAGLIREIAPVVEGGVGPNRTPTVEIVMEDPAGWYGRQQVQVADSTTRSQKDFRQAVLDAIPETRYTLDFEMTTLPLSGAQQTDALSLLSQLNAADGTRHFIRPAAALTDWYTYVSRARTYNLGGASIASLNASSQHVTGLNGWRLTDDPIVNYQQATVDPLAFPPDESDVWIHSIPLFTVTSGQPVTVLAVFQDFVKNAEPLYTSTGSITVAFTPLGESAKIVITSGSTGTVKNLRVAGQLVRRDLPVTTTATNATSVGQYGTRTGSPLSGPLLGIAPSGQAICDHIVYRYKQPLKRPMVTVADWFPTMFSLEPYNLIDLTVAELSVSARVMEITGITGRCIIAAANASVVPLSVHYEMDLQLQEATLQTPQRFFTLDVSTSDGPDVLVP